MKNLFSTAIIAAAVALLVPNNGAEAVGKVAGMMTPVAIDRTGLPHEASLPAPPAGEDSSDPSRRAPEPTAAWVMALGFLGIVVTRRIRGH
jgi:hypothetical protein